MPEGFKLFACIGKNSGQYFSIARKLTILISFFKKNLEVVTGPDIPYKINIPGKNIRYFPCKVALFPCFSDSLKQAVCDCSRYRLKGYLIIAFPIVCPPS